MYDPDAPLVTFDDLQSARSVLEKSPNVRRTPMLHGIQDVFGMKDVELYLKLENMQVTGSYKVRGVINQLCHIPEVCGTADRKLVSLSAGNFGKAFAFLAGEMGLKALVLMPNTAPPNRAKVIESFGAETERMPSSELQPTADKYVKEQNMLYVHSFDDTHLIAGHGSLGLEILEQVSDPDIVVVCCGGGAVLAGTAAAIKLSGHTNCRIYGVQPEGSRNVYDSLRLGHPVGNPVKSIASGLCPPYTGPNAFKHCKEHVDGILLVSEEELVSAMMALYRGGLVVEPSGAAAFSALYHKKVPDAAGKKVVVVITGGNVTPEELVTYTNMTFQ